MKKEGWLTKTEADRIDALSPMQYEVYKCLNTYSKHRNDTSRAENLKKAEEVQDSWYSRMAHKNLLYKNYKSDCNWKDVAEFSRIKACAIWGNTDPKELHHTRSDRKEFWRIEYQQRRANHEFLKYMRGSKVGQRYVKECHDQLKQQKECFSTWRFNLMKLEDPLTHQGNDHPIVSFYVQRAFDHFDKLVRNWLPQRGWSSYRHTLERKSSMKVNKIPLLMGGIWGQKLLEKSKVVRIDGVDHSKLVLDWNWSINIGLKGIGAFELMRDNPETVKQKKQFGYKYNSRKKFLGFITQILEKYEPTDRSYAMFKCEAVTFQENIGKPKIEEVFAGYTKINNTRFVSHGWTYKRCLSLIERRIKAQVMRTVKQSFNG